MRVSYFNPTLDVQVGAAAWFASDPLTLYSQEWPFDRTQISEVHAPPLELVPTLTAIDFEMKLHRVTGKATLLTGKLGSPPTGSSNDWYDRTGNSHSTGGARRSFVSTGFERHLRGLADGLASLRSWSADQRNRPVAHPTWLWKALGTKRVLQSNWQYDTQDQRGWAIYDPAHLESAPLFSLAALGDEEALMHLAWLLAWVTNSTYDPAQSKLLSLYRGSDQERAVGWMLFMLAHCALLGIGIGDACAEFRNTFLAGVDPKQLLVKVVKDLIARPPPIGAGNVDVRTMPLFPASYGFQNAILFAGGGYVLRSGLISNQNTADEFRKMLRDRWTKLWDRMHGTGGMARSFTRDVGFTAADVARVQGLDAAHTYELAPDTAIRDVPRPADTELLAGAAAMLWGADHTYTQQLLFVLPNPDRQDKWDDVGRYANPAYSPTVGAA